MADHASAEAQTRLHQVAWLAKLREEGWSNATALWGGGGSRATSDRLVKRYRQSGVKGLEKGGRAPRVQRVAQGTRPHESPVLPVRQRDPGWGKGKGWRGWGREPGWTGSERPGGRSWATLGRVQPGASCLAGLAPNADGRPPPMPSAGATACRPGSRGNGDNATA